MNLHWAPLLTLTAILTAAFASPALAGTAETPNACKFSYDGEYRTQAVAITASAPAQAAAGQSFTLTGERLEVKLREQLAKDAAAVGLIPSDGSTVSVVTKTWIALKGTNTREGTQVIGPISVTATTTALYDESSQTITATPWQYTPPKLPDTTWTSTGGNIEFSQAGAGAINAASGQLPVGGGGSNVTVAGSAVVQANLPGGANFFMDCSPGETVVTRPEAGAGTSFTPVAAASFAGVTVAGPATNPGGTPPPASGAGGPGGGGGRRRARRRPRQLDLAVGEGQQGQGACQLPDHRRRLRGHADAAHAHEGQARQAQGEARRPWRAASSTQWARARRRRSRSRSASTAGTSSSASARRR